MLTVRQRAGADSFDPPPTEALRGPNTLGSEITAIIGQSNSEPNGWAIRSILGHRRGLGESSLISSVMGGQLIQPAQQVSLPILRGTLQSVSPNRAPRTPLDIIPPDHVTSVRDPTRLPHPDRSKGVIDTTSRWTVPPGDWGHPSQDGALPPLIVRILKLYEITLLTEGLRRMNTVVNGMALRFPDDDDLEDGREKAAVAAIRRVQRRYVEEYANHIPENAEEFRHLLRDVLNNQMTEAESDQYVEDVLIELQQVREEYDADNVSDTE
jgi:hypothetical protein